MWVTHTPALFQFLPIPHFSEKQARENETRHFHDWFQLIDWCVGGWGGVCGAGVGEEGQGGRNGNNWASVCALNFNRGPHRLPSKTAKIHWIHEKNNYRATIVKLWIESYQRAKSSTFIWENTSKSPPRGSKLSPKIKSSKQIIQLLETKIKFMNYKKFKKKRKRKCGIYSYGSIKLNRSWFLKNGTDSWRIKTTSFTCKMASANILESQRGSLIGTRTGIARSGWKRPRLRKCTSPISIKHFETNVEKQEPIIRKKYWEVKQQQILDNFQRNNIKAKIVKARPLTQKRERESDGVLNWA